MFDFVDQPHSHSVDEIIFVVSGSMLVGPRRVGPGTAFAVAADTVYSFVVKEEGLHFINFRASESYVSLVQNGKARRGAEQRAHIHHQPAGGGLSRADWPGNAQSYPANAILIMG